MGIFDVFKKKKPEPKVEAPKTKKKSEKELATERGEPWVGIISMDVNPENLSEGSFELDWNDKFIANLVRAGYQMKPNEPESDIVDRWFQNICRNVVLETYEQDQAMNPDYSSRVVKRQDLGGGRSEFS